MNNSLTSNNIKVPSSSIYNKVYSQVSKTHSPTQAKKIALGVAKNREKRFKTIAKASVVSPRIYKTKSLCGEAQAYFADFIFADINKDLDGDRVPQLSLLDNLKG